MEESNNNGDINGNSNVVDNNNPNRYIQGYRKFRIPLRGGLSWKLRNFVALETAIRETPFHRLFTKKHLGIGSFDEIFKVSSSGEGVLSKHLRIIKVKIKRR